MLGRGGTKWQNHKRSGAQVVIQHNGYIYSALPLALLQPLQGNLSHSLIEGAKLWETVKSQAAKRGSGLTHRKLSEGVAVHQLRYLRVGNSQQLPSASNLWGLGFRNGKVAFAYNSLRVHGDDHFQNEVGDD